MTLDQQMAEIRAKKAPKSRLRAIIKPKDFGANQEIPKKIHVNTALALQKLHFSKVDIEAFISECGDRSIVPWRTANKYDTKEHLVVKARMSPVQFLKDYNKVNKILDNGNK